MSDIFDNINKLIQRDREISKELEEKALTKMDQHFVKPYISSLTRNLNSKIRQTLKDRNSFLLINGDIGSGKTTAIRRMAGAMGWEIYEYGSDTNLEDVKNELKTIVTSINSPPILIVFDDLDRFDLPAWFWTRSDAPKKNSLLDVAKRYYPTTKFLIFATTTDKYSVPFDMQQQYFSVYDHRLPHMRNVVRKEIKKHTGFTLPTGFPKDLHQVQMFIKFGGVHTPYEHEENKFEKMRKFFTKKEIGIPEVEEPIEQWIYVNVFNKMGFLSKNNPDFYHIVASLCLADQYDNDNFLLGFPEIEGARYGGLYFPSYIK